MQQCYTYIPLVDSVVVAARCEVDFSKDFGFSAVDINLSNMQTFAIITIPDLSGEKLSADDFVRTLLWLPTAKVMIYMV